MGLTRDVAVRPTTNSRSRQQQQKTSSRKRTHVNSLGGGTSSASSELWRERFSDPSPSAMSTDQSTVCFSSLVAVSSAVCAAVLGPSVSSLPSLPPSLQPPRSLPLSCSQALRPASEKGENLQFIAHRLPSLLPPPPSPLSFCQCPAFFTLIVAHFQF